MGSSLVLDPPSLDLAASMVGPLGLYKYFEGVMELRGSLWMAIRLAGATL